MTSFDEKDQLTRELHDRSHDVGGHPVSFESVKQSARKIRRRRQIVSGAVAAVVFAVAVPTALAVTDGLNRTQQGPVSPATPTVTQTATPRPDGPVNLTLDGTPRGAAPRVGYFDRGDLVTPDGRHELPANLQGVAPYGDGWIGLGYDGRGAEMLVLDGDFDVIDQVPSGDSFAVSSDGSRVAYVRIDGSGSQALVNAPTSGAEPQTLPLDARPPVTPVGFLDPDTVLFQTEEENRVIGLATSQGVTPLEGFIKVTSANMTTGLVAGQTSFSDTGSCWAVMDPAVSTREMVWETCDHSLLDFSPDGRFILATDPYQSGLGARSLSILDAETGDPMVSYRQDRNSQITLTSTKWETEADVLAIATEGQSWTLLRMSTSGILEEAVDRVTSDPNADLPLWF
jgi:hypothetical protein